MFEEDVTRYMVYDKYNPDNVDFCSPMQDHRYNVPEDFPAKIRPYIIQELSGSEKLLSDTTTDKQSPLR